MSRAIEETGGWSSLTGGEGGCSVDWTDNSGGWLI